MGRCSTEIQAVYNWDCCGLTVGYRRFELGKVGVSRDETEWLYSFTLANFGSVGDIRHSNSYFAIRTNHRRIDDLHSLGERKARRNAREPEC